MAVTITVANEKGGVGKTTTAVNLAAGLALRLSEHEDAASRVLLVDMDPQVHALLAVAFDKQRSVPVSSLAALLTEVPPPSIQRMIQRSQFHPNLFTVPSDRAAMIRAARELPTLMANETRLSHALQGVLSEYAYIVIDTPPNTGDLLINALVAADFVIIPVETSYLGVSGLLELQRTIEQVRTHFKPGLEILGYLPTLCEEQRSEAQEILVEMKNRYGKLMLPAIHKSSDLAYAHSSHMDVFTYRPPRQRSSDNITSSSRATHEYASLVDIVLKQTGGKRRSAPSSQG
jgi:chromosome partitioning protein